MTEPDPEFRVIGEFGAQHLDRDSGTVPADPEVHHAHAARAQPGQQPVAPDPRGITVPERLASQRVPFPGRRWLCLPPCAMRFIGH